MANTSIIHLINQPQQERSRETMQQILDATAAILETKTFEEMTIADIVQEAGCSVGALYGRFQDKNAILQALDEQFFLEFETRIIHLVSPANWIGKPLSYLVESAVRLLVETYSEHRGTLRSLNLKARLYNDSRFRKRELHAWNEFYPKLHQSIRAHLKEIRHPSPEVAIRLGFQQVFFTVREILLWEPLRGALECDLEELVAELTRSYLSYLGAWEVKP